ncbi:MAG TPA: Sec-independent protein translocase protein TatB [Reyranella sp.]|jgi:sec-independent protein translocase protein TatB
MFGIDSPELLVIAIVALVVIGPKELPGLLRTWGRWMAQMRGMASEFRGHVDEMIRQTELEDVKKQLAGTSDGLDLKSLDPTQQIRQHVQEGMAEGEKAFNEAKANFDNPLAEPESAPQLAAEPVAETTAIETAAIESATTETTAIETTATERTATETTVAEATPSEAAAPETAPAVSEAPQTEEKPARAAAE